MLKNALETVGRSGGRSGKIERRLDDYEPAIIFSEHRDARSESTTLPG
jgi:hypothetical protein